MCSNFSQHWMRSFLYIQLKCSLSIFSAKQEFAFLFTIPCFICVCVYVRVYLPLNNFQLLLKTDYREFENRRKKAEKN